MDLRLLERKDSTFDELLVVTIEDLMARFEDGMLEEAGLTGDAYGGVDDVD